MLNETKSLPSELLHYINKGPQHSGEFKFTLCKTKTNYLTRKGSDIMNVVGIY